MRKGTGPLVETAAQAGWNAAHPKLILSYLDAYGAGNSGTQPAAGNGTCGSGTLANTLNGGAYSNGFVYTHLGQLWKAPVNGSGPQERYLYCDSTHPHQLLGIYPTGTTCSDPTGAYYTSTYDAWGNVSSRSYSGTTATLSYDLLDRFTQWYVSSTNQEQYVYDSSGICI